MASASVSQSKKNKKCQKSKFFRSFNIPPLRAIHLRALRFRLLHSLSSLHNGVRLGLKEPDALHLPKKTPRKQRR